MDNGFAEGFAVGQGNACNYGGGAWGNGAWGADLLWIIVLFALLGNGGWGFGGNNGCCNPCGGWGGNALGYELGKVATTNDIASGFNNSAVLNSLNELKLGQAGVQQTLCQGFSGINTAILQAQNASEKGFAQLGYQQQNCLKKFFKAMKNLFTKAKENFAFKLNAVGSAA